ncbi:DNA polymerase III subunit alpha [Convivina intestini]|uniref:DNA polymerase III subunit alpha n=1 Tax=Convivina intestini TaxID=1505726 RepID=UPI0020100153|nr:DNA polymerase III subunit alpha [Convivina intestini]CAH1852023.1 DNA polymerase III subunit alpha [Convivina intestini]
MYAPLQIFSSYSLLKNPNTIDQILIQAHQQGYQAVTLADWNVLYGAVEFYQKAQRIGVKPVFGLTLQVNGLINTATLFPILLTALTDKGYQNLMWLSSAKMTAVDQQLSLSKIAQHLEGIAITLPPNSELVQLILAGDSHLAQYWQKLLGLVNPNQLYLGLNPRMAAQTQEQLADFAHEYAIPVIALDQIDYLQAQDAFSQEVLRAIASNSKLDNLSFLARQGGQNILLPLEEIRQSYQVSAILQTAYANNERLIDQAQVSLNFQATSLPKFQSPAGMDSGRYLRQLAQQGLVEKLANSNQNLNTDLYQKRLDHELAVIEKLGFSDYFLIVWDILNFAHTHNIQTGPGRGSAAGSLVAYCLAITDVDPLAFDLLFERFLNPERAQMPDIDIDWPDNRREEVLIYLHEKYGQRNFAQIITFGTLAAKQALRDTGRVFDLNTRQLSQLSGAIPPGKNGRKVSLLEAWQSEPQLKALIDKIDNGPLLFKTAQQLEGLPRNYSTHAAGVVLSDRPLVETLPVQLGSDERLLTQFEKGPVEQLGLLKIDILGLTNLTILSQALALAKPNLPDNFDIKKIPLNDPQTLALFVAGDTSGVFQFESRGIRNVLRQLAPKDFEQVVAVNALYRPGPSQNIHSFIQRRHGREKIEILDDSLTDILAPTFGIIIYQEQVMRVAEAYAGFTLGQADVLRSAMSKKKLAQMESMKVLFIKGAVQKGHPQTEAEKIFSYIDEFANYGFNRSHAVAYTKLAFELAYLKAHYPLTFYTALLNANLNNTEKIRQYILEAKRAGIQVQGPNVNSSERFWTCSAAGLRMGLHAVHGLRSDFITSLLAEREEHGAFQTVQSFIRRLPEKLRKLETFNQLVYAGALDNFGYNRAELLANLPDLVAGADFGDLILQETKIRRMADLPLLEKLNQEKAVIGLNLSGHPLDAYQGLIADQKIPSINQITQPNQTVQVIGLIDQIKTIRTKKGQDMAFLTLSDQTGNISVTLFPQLYGRLADQLKVAQVVQVIGKSQERQDIVLVANQLIYPTKQAKPTAMEQGTWFLRIDAAHAQSNIQGQLSQLLKKYHGDCPVVLYWAQSNQKQALNQTYWLTSQAAVKRDLIGLLGKENVIFQKKG